MTTIPPAAVPGPEDLPPEEQHEHHQPDPFGERTDEEGRPKKHPEDTEDDADHD